MLANVVTVKERFQRSIRLEYDLNKPEALKGFICPSSAKNALITLTNHVAHTGQCAFTWTGPYGSGKSSLAVLFSALCGSDKSLRQKAEKLIGTEHSKSILTALPFSARGYVSVPVMGQREAPTQIIGRALAQYGLLKDSDNNGWTTTNVLESLRQYLDSTETPGVILFIDEMGKFLEAAAHDGKDIHVFQELAEEANRSNGKLILITILHQAFASYANELSLDARDEWIKVQGRYVDLIISPAGEEQIFLLSQAIKKKTTSIESNEITRAAKAAAKVIHDNKAGTSDQLATLLENTWPLHPVSSVLLSALARKRFGQNQRSIFAFLNSAEPYAFQSFLANAHRYELYHADILWDYLRANFEPTIVSSGDGHKWLIAADAIDRCNAYFDDALYTQILKIIALLDLFRPLSGLAPTLEVIQASVPKQRKPSVKQALEDLVAKSFIIYRRHLFAYSIYAGSDFDIEEALESVKDNATTIDLRALEQQLTTKILLARRHYFETGAHRWVDVRIATEEQSHSLIDQFKPDSSLFGRCLIVLPSGNNGSKQYKQKFLEAAVYARKNDKLILFAMPENGGQIISYHKELTAYRKILKTYPELQGDQVARKELDIRSALVKSKLDAELTRALLKAEWLIEEQHVSTLDVATLNTRISNLADRYFPNSPKIHNELLNRTKPSGSAIAGQNALLRAMLYNSDQPRLGINGYPVEAGLYDSIIKTAGLHKNVNGKHTFVCPEETHDPSRLAPLWNAAKNHLRQQSNQLVSLFEIHELWCSRGFGVKRGLLPILSTAFILSLKDKIALYREEVFRHDFTDTDVTYLAKDPRSIQLRWIDLGATAERLLHAYQGVTLTFTSATALRNDCMQPIDVARLLVRIYDSVPEWTKHTQDLSTQTLKLRTILHNAHDPNELLYIDLPQCFSVDVTNADEACIMGLSTRLLQCLEELTDFYPRNLEKLKGRLLAELRTDDSTIDPIDTLRQRARVVRKLSGDYRLEAFINHIARFDGRTESMERIASLAANKPPRTWVDIDLNRATAEIAELSDRFIKTELYQKIKNQDKYWRRYAVIYRDEISEKPVVIDFNITPQDHERAEKLINELHKSLKHFASMGTEVVLAALAGLSNEIIKESNSNNEV